MLIAQKKFHENIAEYILYMYQIEDVIRSYQFNLDNIITHFVRPQLPDASFVAQYEQWYADLIREMKVERITEAGHLSRLQEVMVELSFLHNSLLTVMNDEKYKRLFETATPFLTDFMDHSNLKDKNHVEVCFHGLYMKLLLRLQKKEISAATEEAFDAMRILIAYLSRAYHQMKNGEGTYWNN